MISFILVTDSIIAIAKTTNFIEAIHRLIGIALNCLDRYIRVVKPHLINLDVWPSFSN